MAVAERHYVCFDYSQQHRVYACSALGVAEGRTPWAEGRTLGRRVSQSNVVRVSRFKAALHVQR
jgi:hypothetical protein